MAGKLPLLLIPSPVTYLFYLEILLGTIVPAFFLSSRKFRENPKYLYISSIFILSGFLLNRLNVSITSLAAMTKASYFPSVSEISVTLMLVTLGMWAFKIIIENFPVFSDELEIEKSKSILESISKPLTISE